MSSRAVFGVVLATAVSVAACAVPTREERVSLSGADASYETTADGRTLTIHAIVGMTSCYAGHDLRVEEGPQDVTVELVAHRRTDTKFCEAGGVLFARSHDLAEPLGQRTVVDATSNAAVAAKDW